MRLRVWTFVFTLWIGTVLAPIASAQTGSFAMTGSLETPRGPNLQATLLNNGKVLVAGGLSYPYTSAELYNPSTGGFSYTGNMTTNRGYFTATLLQNGFVLLAGGDLNSGKGAELYNPSTGTFAATGSMTETHGGAFTATLLNNGEVLIAGGRPQGSCGRGGCPNTNVAELYNPSTGTFAATGSMTVARNNHTATLLIDGTVLIAGGIDGGSSIAGASAELYNPSTGTFTATGSMNQARWGHLATLLGNGTVLIVEGYYNDRGEVYNPSTHAFSYTGTAEVGIFHSTATLLNNGDVLIAGGDDTNGVPTNAAELYNPWTGAFTSTGSLNTARYYGAAIALSNGTVLVAGGAGASGSALTSAEVFTPVGATGYLNPKFLVVGVTYAPPGPSSNTFVSYTNSNIIGNTNSLSQSVASGSSYSVSVSYGFTIPLVGSGQITNMTASGTTQTNNSSSTVTMTFQTSETQKLFGTANYFAPVNNDYDTIWVWLNPAIILTVSNSSLTWNGYGADQTDQPGMDIVGIQLGYLNGHFGAMPSDIQNRINRSWASNQIWPQGQGPALTSADLSTIASADPFSASTYGPNFLGAVLPNPETSDHRFTMSACTSEASFNYLQGAPSQTPAIYSCTLTYTNNSTQAKGISTTTTQTFSLDNSFRGSGFFSAFSADSKSTSSLTWTLGEQSSISSGSSSTAAFSVQGPPCGNQVQGQGPCIPVYDSMGDQPTSFYVYEDNMFGTFMFAPSDYY